MIQIFSNSLGDEELQAMKKVLASKWLGMGPECGAFQEELSKHFGVAQTLLLNSCTAGIYVALRAFGVGRGDEVIISTANFVAIPSAVLELGAKPVFADVDPEYFAILPKEIERLKTKKTKAVCILHYGGHAAPFDEIQKACGDKILILEDSANAVASKYKGKACGALGDAGVFSFDAMKTLVMGDGGALLFKDPAMLEEAKAMRYLGFAPDTTSGYTAAKRKGERWWEYDLSYPAGRFISNDLLAAVGRIQLKKLPKFIQRRKAVWALYQEGLKDIPEISLPPEPLANTTSSYYLYWLRMKKRRDELAHFLKDNGIYSTFRYFPLHLVQYFQNPTQLRNAEEMNEITLNIPLHQNVSDDDANFIISKIREFFRK